jgi:hypothetical protein
MGRNAGTNGLHILTHTYIHTYIHTGCANSECQSKGKFYWERTQGTIASADGFMDNCFLHTANSTDCWYPTCEYACMYVWVCPCPCICVCICMCAYMYVWVYMRGLWCITAFCLERIRLIAGIPHVSMHVCMYVYVCVYVCVCIHTWVMMHNCFFTTANSTDCWHPICEYVCICMYNVCVYVLIYTCAYMHACITYVWYIRS